MGINFAESLVKKVLPPRDVYLSEARNWKTVSRPAWVSRVSLYLFCVNISLILSSFIIQHYLIKRYPYLILYVSCVGLNNAATSRILVNPAVIIIL